MVTVGVHVSIAGSLDLAVDRAIAKGCDCFQIFSRNPRGWAYPPISGAVCTRFIGQVTSAGILPVVHVPYLPNLASPKEEVYSKSVATLAAELDRCGQLGVPYLVTHLGHHLGDGIAGGRQRVIAGINTALDQTENSVTLLMENTAGEKNSVGSTFEHIRSIIDGIGQQGRIGICFDTCHAFAAGYELRTDAGIDRTLRLFDEAIGLSRMRCVHLNDTKGDLGSGLDRHEHIGMGFIGEAGFSRILHRHEITALPLICETPVDDRGNDETNIRRVRDLAAKQRSSIP